MSIKKIFTNIIGLIYSKSKGKRFQLLEDAKNNEILWMEKIINSSREAGDESEKHLLGGKKIHINYLSLDELTLVPTKYEAEAVGTDAETIAATRKNIMELYDNELIKIEKIYFS